MCDGKSEGEGKEKFWLSVGLVSTGSGFQMKERGLKLTHLIVVAIAILFTVFIEKIWISSCYALHRYSNKFQS